MMNLPETVAQTSEVGRNLVECPCGEQHQLSDEQLSLLHKQQVATGRSYVHMDYGDERYKISRVYVMCHGPFNPEEQEMVISSGIAKAD